MFANFVLADEINRAPAKVQSALLEAMQERQVTIGDESFALPTPFLVMATQNPVEQEGTYPLPEAQLDRFLLKVVVEYPTKAEERQSWTRWPDQAAPRRGRGGFARPDPARARDRRLDPRRRPHPRLHRRPGPRDAQAERIGLDLDALVRYGGSPRATIALTLAAKAWAFLHGRAYVTPQDVKAIALDVLRHRVAVTYEAEARDDLLGADVARFGFVGDAHPVAQHIGRDGLHVLRRDVGAPVQKGPGLGRERQRDGGARRAAVADQSVEVEPDRARLAGRVDQIDDVIANALIDVDQSTISRERRI